MHTFLPLIHDWEATCFNIQKHTVYTRLNRWGKGSLIGLYDKLGRERKPIFSLKNKQYAKIVDEAILNTFEKGTDIFRKKS